MGTKDLLISKKKAQKDKGLCVRSAKELGHPSQVQAIEDLFEGSQQLLRDS